MTFAVTKFKRLEGLNLFYTRCVMTFASVGGKQLIRISGGMQSFI